jgi:putative Holliday junction resolvase
MRIMAIDYGLKRVGIAITDPLCTIAQPLLTLKPGSDADLIKRLKCIAEENDVGLILIGNPLSLKGEPTAMSKEILRFLRKLREQVGIEVQLWDERYTSKYVKKRMKSLGLTSTKENIDRVAASVILDEYLQSKRA